MGKQYTTKTTLTLKYIKIAEYDSHLFKIMECDQSHSDLRTVKKEWDDSHFLYIKDKYLPDDMSEGTYYNAKLYFNQFDTKEGKRVTYICAVKLTETKYHPRTIEMEDSSDDEVLEEVVL